MYWYTFYKKHSVSQGRLINNEQDRTHKLLLTSGLDESQMSFQLFTFWKWYMEA